MDAIKGLVLLALTALLAFASGNAHARFVSVDPVQTNPNNGQGFNRYHYGNNNPYRFKDPDGRQNDEAVDPDEMEEMREQQVLQPVSSEALMEPTPSLIPRSLSDPLGEMRDQQEKIAPELNRELSRGPGSQGVPRQAREVAAYAAKNNGAAQPGYRGGARFNNDGRAGGQTLPRTDSNGNKITYKEYDVNPSQKGTNRGAERVVSGSDGRNYYTDDHYKTFQEIKQK